MMKRLLIVALLLSLIATPLVVLASDISNARYYGVIQISNNSTATTNVATTANISTTNLINGNYLNSSANNCVVRTSSGADVPFMPGYTTDNNYPWCIWVPSIGDYGYQSDILYTANSSGGEIRYFPGTGGMTTPDNDATLELGDNFTIEHQGWVDTAFGTYEALGENVDQDESVYLYKNYGADYFNALDVDFELYVASTSQDDGAGAMAITNTIGTGVDSVATDLLVLIQRVAGPVYQVVLRRGFGVANDVYVCSADTPYYCTLERAAGNDSASVKIYTDTARTVLVDTLTLAGYGTTKYQYAYGFINYNTGVGGKDFDGYVKDMYLTDSGTRENFSTYTEVDANNKLTLLSFPQLVYKKDAFITYVSAAGNITSSIAGGGSVTATGVSSGNHTVETSAGKGENLIFTGGVGSNIAVGNVYDAQAKFWMSFRFKLDEDFDSTDVAAQYLWTKYLSAVQRAWIVLDPATGKLNFSNTTASIVRFNIYSVETSWNAGQWYHVIASYSSTDGIRLIVDNGTPVTDADLNATPASNNFDIGNITGAGTEGIIGTISDFLVGTDNLTSAEETDLFNGLAPGDETDYWYIDEGTGTNLISYGSVANAGTAGISTWETGSKPNYISIYVDTDFEDGTILNGVSVPGTGDDWTFMENNVMPYMEYQKIWIGGVLSQYIVWEYGATFTDLSGNDNDATPSFRSASSDPHVSAELISFQPVSEAKAPDYVLGEAIDFIDPAITGNVTGTFTTTPGTGAFPLANVITAIAEATDTPAQLPLLIIAVFCILAVSLSVSATMRRYGSGSILVKTLVIAAIMGIFVALGNFAIDFWMIVVFLVIAVALAFASKQLGFS